METNKLIAGIVAAAIAVIVLAGVLMPALSNATTVNDTFTNEGWFRLTKIDTTSPDVVISWDHTEPNILTVDDVDITMSETGSIPFSIVADGDWALRYFYDPNGVGSGIDCIGTSQNAEFSASTSDNTDMTISLSGGTATCTISGDDTPKTKTYEVCYHISTDGDYTLKKPTVKAYVLGDSDIFGLGRTGWNKGAYNSYINGTIEDGMTINVINRSYTVSDDTIVYSEVDSHESLYLFDKVTFVVSNTAEPPDTHDTTYSQVVVPYQVTAERSVHLSDAMNVILNVIPLLIIVAVLLGVVAVFILRRE